VPLLLARHHDTSTSVRASDPSAADFASRRGGSHASRSDPGAFASPVTTAYGTDVPDTVPPDAAGPGGPAPSTSPPTTPATTPVTARATTVATLARPVAPTTSTTRLSPTTTTTTAPARPSQTGPASWYSAPAGTCAHQTLPFGTVVTVTNLATGATTTCRVSDRGTYEGGRIIDLAESTFSQIADPSRGVIQVKITW